MVIIRVVTLLFKNLVPHVLAHANSKINQQNSAVQNKTEDKQLYRDQTYTDVWSEDIGKEKSAFITLVPATQMAIAWYIFSVQICSYGRPSF